jgi:hypothetical protein
MNPYHHAVSSAKKFGGAPEDYQPIHDWFDASKAYYADYRHRALRHHAQGIFECEGKFGPVVMNSEGKAIPTRFIGEQHVKEDLGHIPSLQDWLSAIQSQDWMRKGNTETSAPTKIKTACVIKTEPKSIFLTLTKP